MKGTQFHMDFAMQILALMNQEKVWSFIFMLANGPFSWKTALDRKIALSTREAETSAVQGARETIKVAIW